MISLLLTYTDGNKVFTRFNGSQIEAVDHYTMNNLLTQLGDPMVDTILFPDTAEIKEIPHPDIVRLKDDPNRG